ncbi:MAG: dipicolinate synthase [Ruminiclostridium sp.]|nr:dipicolinate synthase [Ruminiclostridium sp.]MBR5791754.1 dipicolinate synthase [Ruminiclostridium sp.]
MEEKNIWVVGGDRRQVYLAGLLREDGHTLHTVGLGEKERGLDDLALAHCVILPLPVLGKNGRIHTPLSQEKIDLSQVLDHMRPGQVLCGGMVSPEVREAGERAGLQVFDYYAREECMVANAVPTAEGAVQVAMEQMPFTLHSARVLVLGFGRVGKLTAHRMRALGARVTVAAADYGDLAWAAAYNYESIRLEELACELGGFQLIVNTIPAQVLDARRLAWVDPAVFILDLASAPGGVDLIRGEELGLHILQAPGLPGRTAPVTAAAAIRDSIYHILWELEE